ncbi:MAG: hypothetical protein ABIB65_05560 [Candidatus Margulisiibacteriota bacterium]
MNAKGIRNISASQYSALFRAMSERRSQASQLMRPRPDWGKIERIAPWLIHYEGMELDAVLRDSTLPSNIQAACEIMRIAGKDIKVIGWEHAEINYESKEGFIEAVENYLKEANAEVNSIHISAALTGMGIINDHENDLKCLIIPLDFIAKDPTLSQCDRVVEGNVINARAVLCEAIDVVYQKLGSNGHTLVRLYGLQGEAVGVRDLAREEGNKLSATAINGRETRGITELRRKYRHRFRPAYNIIKEMIFWFLERKGHVTARELYRALKNLGLLKGEEKGFYKLFNFLTLAFEMPEFTIERVRIKQIDADTIIKLAA